MTDLKDLLINEGIVKIKTKEEEPFTLKSGKKSRLFIDIKEASLNPIILREIVNIIKNMELDNFNLKFDKFGSVAVGGVPIASVLSFIYNTHQIIVRSEKHDRGTQTKIIGDCKDKNVLLIEDVATSGGSIVSAVKSIREAGGICDNCIVIVDRQEGAKELCTQNNINLMSILQKSDFGIKEEL